MGLRRRLLRWYAALVLIRFSCRRLVLGFEHANLLLRVVHKLAIGSVLRSHGASIGDGEDLESPLVIHNADTSYANLHMGSGCHTGKNVLLDLRDEIRFGDRVTVSMGVSVLTHMNVGQPSLRRLYPDSASPVVVGNDCYIGANATLLPGVDLGTECLVAAGSVVRGHFPPKSLISGVPARVVRSLDESDGES